MKDDTDYAPVVRALTRRGKTITCVGRRTKTRVNALQRSSQFFIELDADFIRSDVETFAMLKPTGALERILDAMNDLQHVRARGFSTEDLSPSSWTAITLPF